MDPVKLQAQRELDADILAYVREMQRHAPVSAESVTEFERRVRRRRVTASDVEDRLAYLVSAGLLEAKVEWEGGELTHYRITAEGMDTLDGARPPRGWKGGAAR